MNNDLDIDQVIVRKAGGYNLQSTKWWAQLSSAERQDLLVRGDVQFFACGVEVDSAVAAASLDTAHTNVIAPKDPERSTAPTTIVVPAFLSQPDGATYVRRVVEGPLWLVTRRDASGETQLHELHGRGDASVYDLGTPSGGVDLSRDLLLDSLGAPDAFANAHAEAFAHFQQSVFDLHLSNRPWEVPAEKIRNTLADNPYLTIADNTTV